MSQWFVALAQASGAPASPQGSIFSTLTMMVVIFAIFYFLLIRPQQRQAKAHRAMLSALKKGDSVVVAGGIHGRIVEVEERTLLVEIADRVKVKVNREAVAGLANAETKSAASDSKS